MMRANRCLAGAWVLLFGISVPLLPADTNPSGWRFRIGASVSLGSTDVNENDARAALHVWAETLSRETGMKIETSPEILSSPEKLLALARQGMLDAFSLTTPEFPMFAPYVDMTEILIDDTYATGGEEYVILTHAESGFQKLADLKGRNLILEKANVMALAGDWLAMLLTAAGLPQSERHFGQVTSQTKLSKVVLPVFFRQADACLVSHRHYDTMSELNPQIQKKLRVIATSPRLIPVFIAINRACTPEQKEKFKGALKSLGSTVAGRQILALFSSRRVISADGALLTPSLELVKAAARLKGQSTTPTR